MRKKCLAALVAVFIASSATGAPTNLAINLSAANPIRAGSSLKQKSQIGGTSVVFAVLAAVASVVGYHIVSGDDDSPDSN